jgi:mono/diheme cytochrome c family protein
MRLLASIAACAFFTIAAPLVASAQQSLSGGDPASGRAFALQTCTPCHVVAQDQISPPRFAMTANALHAFLATPHPTMPNLILTPQETDDVVAYILSLHRRS